MVDNFDPNAFLQKAQATEPEPGPRPESTGFDPSEFLEKSKSAALPFTQVESALIGAGQGATFDFGDELLATGRAAFDAMQGENFRDSFQRHKVQIRNDIKSARAENPVAFTGGFAAGAIGSTAVVPGLAPIRGLTAAGKIGRAAAGGGLIGAGSSEADIVGKAELGEFTQDVAIGAALGAGAEFGLGQAGKVIKGLTSPTQVRRFAERKAVKAAGALGGEMKKLQKAGQLHNVGRTLLDKKVVKAFSTLDEIAERSGELKKAAGMKIGQSLKEVDDMVQGALKDLDDGKLFGFLPDKAVGNVPSKENMKIWIQNNFQFNMKKIADRIDNELIAPNRVDPTLANELKKLGKLSERFRAGNTVPIEVGRRIKTSQGRTIRFGSDTVPEAFKKDVYGVIKTELEDLVGRLTFLEQGIQRGQLPADEFLRAFTVTKLPAITKTTPLDDVAKGRVQDFIKKNREFGALKEAERISSERAGFAAGNREISLTDTIAASGAFAATGSLGPAIALGALNKFGRKFGASLQATGADKLANVLEFTPQIIQKYLPLLNKAAGRSPNSLIATHVALFKTDPEYRDIFENRNQGLQLPGR